MQLKTYKVAINNPGGYHTRDEVVAAFDEADAKMRTEIAPEDVASVERIESVDAVAMSIAYRSQVFGSLYDWPHHADDSAEMVAVRQNQWKAPHLSMADRQWHPTGCAGCRAGADYANGGCALNSKDWRLCPHAF